MDILGKILLFLGGIAFMVAAFIAYKMQGC